VNNKTYLYISIVRTFIYSHMKGVLQAPVPKHRAVSEMLAFTG